MVGITGKYASVESDEKAIKDTDIRVNAVVDNPMLFGVLLALAVL